MPDEQAPYPNEVAPGRYESPLESYAGHVQFPAPLMFRHVEAWWQVAIEDIAGQRNASFEVITSEWRAAKILLLDYGKWEIEGVNSGDVADDNVPAEVMNFVMDCAEHYIYPKLPPTARRRARTGTS